MVTFIDFFSGIGGFHSGFEKAGMKCVGWCEFDKFAQKSYRALYDTDGMWFSDDVRKGRGWELPNATVWTFGFPCQDVSIAGKQRGIRRGTRSGLFYEIMRLIDECEENKPQWLVCENVRNLLSIEGGQGMLAVLSEMDKRGYDAEWKVFNSKDYGVPQNRERVYIVGRLRDGSTEPLLPKVRQSPSVIRQVIGGSQGMRVYDPSGTSCTLSANGGGMGAKTGLYAVGGYRRNNAVYGIDGVSGTLCARDYKGPLKIAIKNATEKGYLEAQNGDGVDLAYPKSKTRRGRVQVQVSNTLTTKDNLGVVLQDGTEMYIRKLTPRECWRLQGFTDEQFEKAKAVNSDSQLYKQAGNAVTVNITYEIGKHIMNIINKEKT